MRYGLSSPAPRIIQAAAAIILAIFTGARTHTMSSILCSHVHIADTCITILLDKEKSWDVRQPREKRTAKYYRTQDNEAVFGLLQRWSTIAPKQPNAPFFGLPSQSKLPSDFLTTALYFMLDGLQLHAPGIVGHSTRYNTASMPASIGVLHSKICFAGGWSSTGNAIHTYLDPTYPFHPISAIIFNGLLPPHQRHSVTPHLLLAK